jgi:predicted transcriptional regulator
MRKISYHCRTLTGADHVVRVRLSRGRRRVLLALLSGADNLHSQRLRSAAQVWDVNLHAFLRHLTDAGWLDSRVRMVSGRKVRCYRLTDSGRVQAAGELTLVMPDLDLLDPRAKTRR